jgi:hypothetical protein
VIVEACRTHGIICNALLAEWKNADPLSPGFVRTERRVNKIISLLREHSTEIADPMLGFQDLTVMTKLFGDGASAAKTGDSTIVSLDTAARATREYADFYFHASPFATDALDSIWSGCSDVSSVRFACVARFDADGIDYDEASIRRCMDSGDKNWACREGRKRAMKLVNPQ